MQQCCIGLKTAEWNFCVAQGDTVSGEALPVADPRLETVEFYKVSNLKDTVREVVEETPPPPWRGVPPPLSVYRERGHRRLAARTYEEKCTTCIWGCQMAVEMIIDHWNPSKRRYRTETFWLRPSRLSSLPIRPGAQGPTE
jgi:hypothetical protein